MFKNIYNVTVKSLEDNEPGAFARLNLGEGYSEFVCIDDNGNEVYIIYTDLNINRELDTRDGVINYTVCYGN